MRIAIIVKQPGFVRYIRSQVEFLLDHGHAVHVGIQDGPVVDEDNILAELVARRPGITLGTVPRRHDAWVRIAGNVRGALDYFHYLLPEFASAQGLRERARKLAGAGAQRAFAFCWRLGVGRSATLGSAILRVLRAMECGVPPSPAMVTYIRELDVEAVVVTGLVWPRSPQVDVIRAARRLGLPTGYIVNSWDNLTNKGDIKTFVDRVIVWNDQQRQEAIGIHGVSPERVVVVGAATFDRWFARHPTRSRAEFCARLGLDPDRPLILYTCSSPRIAPGASEPEFVKQWLTALRTSAVPVLREAAVIIRPHPFNAQPWQGVDFGFDQVAVFPQAGSTVVGHRDQGDYFDSLYYSDAAVGVNTSAFLEAAIAGAKSFTVSGSQFADTQEGTVHFHYLTELGIVHSASSIAEHVSALSVALGQSRGSERHPLPEVIPFVRPGGHDHAATPLAAEALLDLAKMRPAGAAIEGPVAWFWRAVFSPLAAIEGWRRLPAKARASAPRKRGGIAGRAARALVGGTLGVLGWLGWRSQFEQRALAPAVTLLSEFLPRKHAAGPAQSRAIALVHKLEARDRSVHKALKAARDSGKPVIVGPWLSEVGFEVLYWIPFLNWFQQHYKIDRERVTIISRGGVASWYDGLGARYVDLFDYYTPGEFRERNIERQGKTGHQKQSKVSEFEREIVARVAADLGMSKPSVVYPEVMFRLFDRYWAGLDPSNILRERTIFKPFARVQSQRSLGLPDDYVAVKFYFRESFPDNFENRKLMLDVIRRIASQAHVVLLGTGLRVDDHEDFTVRAGERVHTIDHLLTASDNLRLQSEIICGARAFVGTYGGMSYVASYFGVPSIGFESDAQYNRPAHLETALREMRAFRGPLHVIGAADMPVLETLIGTWVKSSDDEQAGHYPNGEPLVAVPRHG